MPVALEICLILAADVLNALIQSLCVRYDIRYVPSVLLDGSVLFLGLLCVKFFSSILSRAHVGYLHLVGTSH